MGDLTLEEAYRKWSEDLGRYATVLVGPSDAPDVVANAIVSVMASGRWDEVLNPKSYLLTAVLNSARMQARSRSRRSSREARAAGPEATEELDTDIHARANLGTLSLQQRAVVHFTYWEDHTPATIAEILGVSEGTVRRQLARARAKLKKVMTVDID